MSETEPDTDNGSDSDQESKLDAQYKYIWETSSGYKYRFKNVPDMLKKVMKHVEKARNYDYKLKHFVWTQVQELDPSNEEEFKKCINGETIRRARQIIQQEGEYLPTEPKILYKRNFTVAEVQDYYEIKKPQIPHKYLDFLGKKIEEGRITEEELEEKYIGDLDKRKHTPKDKAGIKPEA